MAGDDAKKTPGSPASPTGEKKEPVLVTMGDHEANKARGYPSNFIRTSKYNLLTFLPLNLFHQFRKVSNFYFLVNMIFALIPGVSPINPATAVLPLVFVIGVALVKDGYEDYVRHKNDHRANSIKTNVLRKKKGEWHVMEIESADVEVGDIIYIQNGEEVRADVLLLSSTGQECAAFIDTCNLDGETNLKSRKAVQETWHLNSEDVLKASELEIKTGPPNPGLLHWTGLCIVDGKEVAVGLDQFLYRSCILKNTEHAWGLVLYAGVDTKMFRNLQEKPPKFSALDTKLNYLIVGVLIAQHCLLFLMAGLAVWWNKRNTDQWHLRYYINDLSGFSLWGYRYLTYFILMSYMIPISLFVTIELCKVAQAQFMRWDHEMFEWMYEKWVWCNPNTSNLNEQLAMVKFIFSDKTGTLTENVMVYKRGDILGKNIDSDDWETSRGYLRPGSSNRAEATHYFLALALCHTIQPFPDPKHEGRIIYDGASPDEVALVRASVEHGIVLKERSVKSITLEFDDKMHTYEILATLEFTPDRKMMSIIVKDDEGTIHVFTKGADSFVIPNLHKTANDKTLPPTSEVLKELASEGLRTLIVCGKTITQEQFNTWYQRFIEAGKALDDRSAIVDKVCLEMEKDLLLIGITAIEDRLQDKVPETLQFFLDAGVIVWMLTGDKRETAVTIAATSSLANPQEDYIEHIDIGSLLPDDPQAKPLVGQQLQKVQQCIEAGDKRVSFVIDGPALNVAMEHHMDLFLALSQKVNSAVCCRLTPLQKANVVNMFQTKTGQTALAIGDGANDVSMIQEGRVGVGIMGLEGAQAALAADYAIPRFKHLRRLCCVHGRYAVARNSLCVCYSFYKNLIIALVQFWYALFCGFSGQTLMDGWLLAFFNFAFTSIPPLFLGIFDKDLTEEALMNHPELYAPLSQGLYFDLPTLTRWFGEAIMHSIVLFFVMYPTMLRSDVQEHHNMDVTMIGTIMMTATIYLVLTKNVLHIRYWQGVQLGGFIFSYLLYLCFILIYAAIPSLFGYTTFYHQTYTLMSDPKFWMYVFLFVVGLLFPIDVAIMFVQRQLFPTLRDKMQERYELVDLR
jgi:phospholipid-transporting ATPase